MKPVTSADRRPAPPPGIYPGVPAELYHAWDAASNSILTRMARSPAHARAEMERPRVPTPALLRGDAVHTAVLEPDAFAKRYTVAGPCVETVRSGANAGQRCPNDGRVFRSGEWRCGQHDRGESEESRRVLSAADYATCTGMRDAVRAHPTARDLLDVCESSELSVVFCWPGTDIPCKARIDIPAFDAGVIADLKTTADASPSAFEHSVYRYGYHRQAPFYRAACAAHGIEVRDSLIVAVEDEPPYGTTVYRISDDAVGEGRQHLQRLLDLWQRCRGSGVWPAYPTAVTDITLPAYAWSHHRTREEP